MLNPITTATETMPTVEFAKDSRNVDRATVKLASALFLFNRPLNQRDHRAARLGKCRQLYLQFLKLSQRCYHIQGHTRHYRQVGSNVAIMHKCAIVNCPCWVVILPSSKVGIGHNQRL